MMLQAIFAKHVQAGDDILLPGGEKIVVTKVEVRGGTVRLESSHPVAKLEEYDIVGLGHRPWPGGTTSGSALQRVIESAGWLVNIVGDIGRPRSVDAHVDELEKAIQDYKLGKPVEHTREKPGRANASASGSGFNEDGWH